MSTDTDAFRDDLAFLRNLVEGGEQWTRQFGETYFAAGLIYGAQMLGHAGQFLGLLPTDPAWAMAIGLGPTVVFLAVLAAIIWRHRRTAQRPSSAGRVVASVFGAAGLSNFALLAVIGSVSWREQSIATWLIYPCSVFILQGAAWLVACAARRRAWMALVAAGWFATAVAMGITVTSIGLYVLFAGLGIWTCMALPGWLVLRASPRVAASPAASHPA